MIQILDRGMIYEKGMLKTAEPAEKNKGLERKGSIAAGILSSHNQSNNSDLLRIRFDSLTSHDITFVGIIQTARASGLKEFPVPYVMTNCHNSLCAVGGTINEDDHVFGLSAAKKYGGVYVPAHQSVIHQYNREMMAACGKMILGSDSHTRYGALGTMGVGEGGPELVKQLLSNTYDITPPEIVAVYLTGKVKNGVGPQDVALAIIGAVFANGFAKNKVLEFIGDGVSALSVDFRTGIDVMTTETTCLSSIWMTDDKVKEYYAIHGRPQDFEPLEPEEGAYYDGALLVDLSEIDPMIALPFHPSNAYSIKEFNENAADILRETERECIRQLDNPKINFNLTNRLENGRMRATQGIIAGCSGGTFENICAAAAILKGASASADYFSLSVYPASTPAYYSLLENGSITDLMAAGSVIKTAFCGPCFGAGDTPANNGFSLRHTTRNFVNREGSKPASGQIASVALMDARSIAATAKNGGYVTSATDEGIPEHSVKFIFHKEIYDKCVYDGTGKPDPSAELIFGPGIADWPEMIPLPKNLLMQVASVIHDPVTTTDELIPSGETSSYRSNPLKLAEFTLSRKDPGYVGRAKEIEAAELARRKQKDMPDQVTDALSTLSSHTATLEDTGYGSSVYAVKPGDGSAREQAASCQRVLGGVSNIATEYATKRYRSNLINWGILPLLADKDFEVHVGDFVYLPDIRKAVEDRLETISARIMSSGNIKEATFRLGALTDDERTIILEGSLINYYRSRNS